MSQMSTLSCHKNRLCGAITTFKILPSWMTSQCPKCGVVAVLRDKDNVVLMDCGCAGSSNPWKLTPTGTLVVWREWEV